MIRQRNRLLWSVFFVVGLVGCGTTYSGDEDTEIFSDLGKQKRLSFNPRQCFLKGCPLTPYARRTVDDITVETVGVGVAELQVQDKSGVVLDSVDVEVRQATTLAFAVHDNLDRVALPALSLKLNGSAPENSTVYVVPSDSNGNKLLANFGFDFQSENTSVVKINPGSACVLGFCFGGGDFFETIVVGLGTTEIQASGCDVAATLPVTVASN